MLNDSQASARLIVVREDGLKTIDMQGLTAGEAFRHVATLRGNHPE